jgi:hypothetical protein
MKYPTPALMQPKVYNAHPEPGRTKIPCCYPQTDDVLRHAGERLLALRPR